MNADIANFKQAAQSGQLKYNKDTARNLAAHYDTLARTLTQQKSKLADLTELDGFGGFNSSQQLRKGFNGKAVDAHELIDQYIAAAYRMKEAFLISGGLLDEADAAAAAAVRAMGGNL